MGVNGSLEEVCTVDKQCSVLDREQGTPASESTLQEQGPGAASKDSVPLERAACMKRVRLGD